MFDFGWTELLVIAVVAIIVVGPKDLPGMLRSVGQMFGRLRRMAGEFQKTFNDAVKDAEKQAGVEDIRKEMDSVRKLNPVNDLKNTIEATPDSTKKSEENKPAEQSAINSESDSASVKAEKEDETGQVKTEVGSADIAKNAIGKQVHSESAVNSSILAKSEELKKNNRIQRTSVLDRRTDLKSGFSAANDLVSRTRTRSLITEKKSNLLISGTGSDRVKLSKNAYNMTVLI